ncbi:MAG: hypothetical protein K0R92_2706 [Lachnospiraceae bacterium]|jgi:hypothetical protein|nr:hypothetical protein [Lachnospiraceae bacterium]
MFKICFLDDFYYDFGTIDTTFYVNVDGIDFPDGQWTDYTISVLYMWISNILDSYKNKNAKFVLYFMDGPYYINCSKQESEIHMAFIEDKKCKTTICECNENIDIIINELHDASYKIIQAAEKHDLGKLRDLNNLKRSLELLKALHNS